MKEAWILISIYLGGGLLMIALALPMIAGRVPRNGIYGFRVPKTLSSDDIWYPANRYMGKRLLWAGQIITLGALILLGITLCGVKMSSDALGYIGLALTLIPLFIAVIQGFRYLGRL